MAATASFNCGGNVIQYQTDSSLLGQVLDHNTPTLLTSVLAGNPYLQASTTCSVTVTVTKNGGTGQLYYYGSPNNYKAWTTSGYGTTTAVYLPYFALVTNGFQIFTPSSDSSGIFFSGAASYCDSAFASSTGISSYIGGGLCLALGYLFIPTPASVQSFQNIPSDIAATPPLSWFGELVNIFESGTASTTTAFPALAFNLGTTTSALGVTNIVVLSTSTLSTYMPDSTRLAFKYLIAIVFYLAAASAIYSQLKRTWQHS